MMEINKMETNRTIHRINETKSCVFEKISKIDKYIVQLSKKKTEKTQINKIRDEKKTLRQISLKSTRSLKNISKPCISEYLYLEEMDKFLDT
jgi:hypothetical protein